MSRMRGTPTLGPYSRTDIRPGRLADSGSTLIAPDTPSMSKVSTTAHRVSPGQIPLMGHLSPASRPCTTVIPANNRHSRESGNQGRRGWVPVSTGTTGGRASLPSFPSTQNFTYPSFPRRKTPAQPSFPRRRESDGGGDGFPSPRERRATARPYRHSRQTRTSHFRHSRAGRPCVSVIPATAGIQGWGGWVPVSTGTTGDRASLPSFPSTQNFTYPSFPRRKTPAQPSFPRRRESRGGGDGFPSPRERQAAARPYRHSRQTRTSHFRHSRAGRPCTYPSFPQRRESRGGGDGFPSPRERRAAAHPVSAASPPTRREYIVSALRELEGVELGGAGLDPEPHRPARE